MNKMQSTEKAVTILENGGVLAGESYYYVHSAVRRLLGIDDGHMVSAELVFDHHNYFRTIDGRVIDVDYKTQTARIVSQEYFESVLKLRGQRVKSEVDKLLSTGRLNLSGAAVSHSELVEAVGADPQPVRLIGSPGSGSHCGSAESYYTLQDGRILIIGNGADEGWETARIRERSSTILGKSSDRKPLNQDA